MPPTGRHQVGMGRSMTRFLRQRKGLPALTSQTKPVSSYFHFKCGFKSRPLPKCDRGLIHKSDNSIPESVDNAKPGVVEVSQDISTMNVRVERASHNVSNASSLVRASFVTASFAHCTSADLCSHRSMKYTCIVAKKRTPRKLSVCLSMLRKLE